jgi:hypothetical protein
LERALAMAKSKRELPQVWLRRTEAVAQFEEKTCLAALGTGLLATATDDTVDPLTLKVRAGNRGYSARGLAHDVLVPASVEFGFLLRTTGREPLNNQPFFHSDRIDAMPRVKHPGEIRKLVEYLEAVRDLREDEAVVALAAFLRQRLNAAASAVVVDLGHVSSDLLRLSTACREFLDGAAESGKRAQALVTAALDLVFDDVRTAKVFDPSRMFPGDVQAYFKLEPVVAVEVRAKVVTYSDAIHFVRSVAAAGFPHAMIAAFASVDAEIVRRCEESWVEQGVLVSVQTDYPDLLVDALAWSRKPLHQQLAAFPERVIERLRQLEVNPASLALWSELASGDT